jgi:hypothetical protein
VTRAWLTLVGVAFIGAVFLLGGCVPPAPPVPPPKPPVGAPSYETACARGRELGCAWSRPTPNGGTCEAVLHNTEDSGIVVVGVECLTMAESCAAADRCGRAR